MGLAELSALMLIGVPAANSKYSAVLAGRYKHPFPPAVAEPNTLTHNAAPPAAILTAVIFVQVPVNAAKLVAEAVETLMFWVDVQMG